MIDKRDLVGKSARISNSELRTILNLMKNTKKLNRMLNIGTSNGHTIINIYNRFPSIKIDSIDYIPNKSITNDGINRYPIKKKEKYTNYMIQGDKISNLIRFDEGIRKCIKRNNISNINLYTNGSDEFFSRNEKTYDFVFIDGNHLYDVAKRDLDNSLSVLNNGGIIIMHDIKNGNGFWKKRNLTCAKVFDEYEGKKELIGKLGVIYGSKK